MKNYLAASLLLLTMLSVKVAKAASAPVTGVASWYGSFHEGKPMANGKPFRRMAMTAASRTLKLGTHIRVYNLENMQSVDVTVTDRGPYVGKRILDLSEAAAIKLGYAKKGLARVLYVVLPEPQPILARAF
jgi:rare lipoprotein A